MADINFFPEIKFNEQGNAVLDEQTKKREEGFNRQMMKEVNASSHIPMRFATTTFNDFPCKLTDEVKEFCKAENNDHILILMGHAGCGKTTLMTSAMHERALAGMNAGTYFSLRTLASTIRSTRSFKADESEIDFYNRMATTSFLCLDEVGTSEDQTLESNFLRTVIALRYDNMLPMIISTNFNWEAFKNLISKGDESDPIIDRLKSISIRKGINEGSHR